MLIIDKYTDSTLLLEKLKFHTEYSVNEYQDGTSLGIQISSLEGDNIWSTEQPNWTIHIRNVLNILQAKNLVEHVKGSKYRTV